MFFLFFTLGLLNAYDLATAVHRFVLSRLIITLLKLLILENFH